MKIFLDTADLEHIIPWVQTGIVDGVTTNPTNLSAVGGDPKQRVLAICDALPHGEISVEITEHEPQAVYAQARAIAALRKNILVKIPCHVMYYPIIKKLVSDGVRINITLVFTLAQSLMMAKLGVTYISLFIGRLQESGADAFSTLHDIRTMLDTYHFSAQLLAASVREEQHVYEAIVAGAHAATMSPSVLEKIVAHQLTDQGMKKFTADWQRLGMRQFP